MSDEMRLTPEFGDHVLRVLEERGGNPFEARRFFQLPAPAQYAALPYLEDRSIAVRELISDLEEAVEGEASRS